MNKSRFLIVAAAAAVSFLFGAAVVVVLLSPIVSAQEEAVAEPSAVSAIAPILLQYQGRLTDPGTSDPVADGSYTMVLRLYSEPSGGTPLWAEAKDVPVQDGLFSTVLGDTTPLSQGLFDGRALWLGIKVGADQEATPRQQVLPVAYALSLVPGAVIDGDLTVNGSLKGSHAANASAHHKRYTDAEAASAAISHPEIVTQYEFEDHLYGGMHTGRAIAYGIIQQDGQVASATGNVSSRKVKIGATQYYEITIDGHNYDQFSYVTMVTSITGGFTIIWSSDGKLNVGIYYDSESTGEQAPFHFVIYKP